MRILTPFPSGPLLCCTNVRAKHKLALLPRLLERGSSREPVFSAVRVSKSCKGRPVYLYVHIPLNELTIYLERNA